MNTISLPTRNGSIDSKYRWPNKTVRFDALSTFKRNQCRNHIEPARSHPVDLLKLNEKLNLCKRKNFFADSFIGRINCSRRTLIFFFILDYSAIRLGGISDHLDKVHIKQPSIHFSAGVVSILYLSAIYHPHSFFCALFEWGTNCSKRVQNDFFSH